MLVDTLKNHTKYELFYIFHLLCAGANYQSS